MRFPKRKGEKGSGVIVIQKYLNTQLRKLNLKPLVVDGDFGSLTAAALQRVSGQTEVSSAFFDTMRRLLADLYSKRAAGSVDFSEMDGGQLITWITKNDMKIQHGLLLLREMDTRLDAKGMDTSRLRAAMKQVASSYNQRNKKILSDGFIKTNKAVGSAYKWLVDKWNDMIGIPPLIPIAAGIVIVGLLVTGTVLISRYMGDAISSRQEIERDIPALMAAYKKLSKPEYDSLVSEIQDFGAKKFGSGGVSSFGNAIKYGTYLIGGILVVTVIRNVARKK